jgi:hypothetical protein
MNPNMLQDALSYANRGWHVFPCHTNRCSVSDATTDARQIRKWWKQCPDADIGIATGARSGLIVLDVDPRRGGDESLAELFPGALPRNPTAQNGIGGTRFFFAHPGRNVRSRVNVLRGIDVHGDGDYVLAPSHGSTEELA